MGLLFGRANALSLREVSIPTGEFLENGSEIEQSLKLEAGSFDFVIESQLHHHLEDINKAYKAAHRLLKPGGIAIFAGRGINHQRGIWHIIEELAKDYNFQHIPRAPYPHYPLEQMQSDLEDDPRFRLIKPGRQQFGRLWVPNTDEDWPYYRSAILYTLLATSKEARELSGNTLVHYLDGHVRHRQTKAPQNIYKGYFFDWVDQNYFVCEAVK